jgi:hypothetical protein
MISGHAILLQSDWQFIKQQDTTAVFVGLGLIVGFIVILLIGGRVSARGRGSGSRAGARYTRRAFRRTAAAYGLSRTQTEILENLARVCRVGQPMLLFTNSGLLDDVLKKGIYSVTRGAASDATRSTPEDRQKRLATYLSIKQSIERNTRRAGGIRSTTLIRNGQDVNIVFPDGSRIQTRVTANLRRMLACEIPEGDGRRLRWRRGTRVRALFWRHGDSGYVFNTKILGYDTMGGHSVFLLQHSQTLRRSQRRAHRRRELNRNCFFYPILILESGRGRRARKRAVVQVNFRHVGRLQDVSAGGCSISSQIPLEPGKLLRVDFEIGRHHRLTAYGKVRRVTRDAGRRQTMHVMFTKVSSLALNEILSYVYGYSGVPAPERRYAIG